MSQGLKLPVEELLHERLHVTYRFTGALGPFFQVCKKVGGGRGMVGAVAFTALREPDRERVFRGEIARVASRTAAGG